MEKLRELRGQVREESNRTKDKKFAGRLKGRGHGNMAEPNEKEFISGV